MVDAALLHQVAAAIVDSELDIACMEELLAADDQSKRPQRRGGWGGVTPRHGDLTSTHYLNRFRYRYWESRIWLELSDGRTYEMGGYYANDFRKDYMLPRAEFDRFVADAQAIPGLACKEPGQNPNRKGPLPVPLKHKVAVCLYKWCNNVPWKTVCKLGRVSESMIRKFSTRLAKLFVATYYAQDVHPPRTPLEINRTLTKHARLGYEGLLGFWDGVPVEWLNCPAGDKWKYCGKEGYATRSYMVCGNMNREIYETGLTGFPGTTNDLTKILYSPFMREMRTGMYSRMKFDVQRLDGSTQTLTGLWSVGDNGFHYWPQTQMPSKTTVDIWDRRFSRHMESSRKPGSENIFGVMKARMPGLLTGVTVNTPEQIDDLFKLAALLHNRLLRYDQLDTIGEFDNDWSYPNGG